MKDVKKTKILIFDAVHPVPVGKQLYETLQAKHIDAVYFNAKKMKINKGLYQIRRGVKKLLRNLTTNERPYYYHPWAPNTAAKIICDVRPSLVLVIGFFYPYLYKETLLKLKQEIGFKLCLLDTDTGNMMPNYRKLIYFFEQEIQLHDQVFSFSKPIADFMRRLGFSQVQFFPYGSPIIPPRPPQPKKYDICFVGIPEMRRLFYLEKLCQYNLVIYGGKWKRYRPLMSKTLWSKVIPKNIWRDELYQLLDQTKIVLNLNNAWWQSLNTGVNLRVFEALAAKSFLLTDHCEELESLFTLDQDLVSFKTPEELIEKINHYLVQDTRREEIAAHGYQTFLTHYTWEKRVDDLLEKIEVAETIS